MLERVMCIVVILGCVCFMIQDVIFGSKPYDNKDKVLHNIMIGTLVFTCSVGIYLLALELIY